MKKNKALFAFLMAILIIAASISGFYAGKIVYDKETISFYAILTDISVGQDRADGYIYVDGIPENDVNHRGRFYVSLDNVIAKRAIFNENGDRIDQTMLKPLGITVRISYSGEVLESYPAQILDVCSVQIIDVPDSIPTWTSDDE